MVTPVLQVRNLVKRLDSGVVLEGMDFELYPGDVLGIVGPSGVGKSVLLRVLATLLPLSSGELWIDGVPSHETDRVRRSIGFGSGRTEKFPETTVRGFLSWFARAYDVDDAYVDVRVEEALSLTRLSPLANDRMTRLQPAELRRAGLARSLLHAPSVLLLDDPLAHVQGGERDLWVQILERVRNTGVAMVVASETVRDMRHLLTHACVLAAGRVLGCGPVGDLDSRVSQLRSLHLQVVGASRAVAVLNAWPGVFQAVASGDIIKVLFMGDSSEVLGLVTNLANQGLPVISFREEPAYLM